MLPQCLVQSTGYANDGMLLNSIHSQFPFTVGENLKNLVRSCKTQLKSNLEDTGFIWRAGCSSSPREGEAQAWRQGLEQRLWNTAYTFAPKLGLATFLIQARLT